MKFYSKVIILKRKPLIITLSLLVLGLFFIGSHEKVLSVVSKTLKPIYAVKTDTNQIAITFDISWGEENVLPILDILKSENVQATFFLSSPWAEKKPHLVKEIVAHGHEIGSHGRRHIDLNTLSESELIEELDASKKILEELTGQKISLLRPPNGAYNNTVISVANRKGYRVIQWSVEGLDIKAKNYIFQSILISSSLIYTLFITLLHTCFFSSRSRFPQLSIFSNISFSDMFLLFSSISFCIS